MATKQANTNATVVASSTEATTPKTAVPEADKADVVATSAEVTTPKPAAPVEESVYITSSLQSGMTFRDLKSIKGGTFTIPGVNYHLHGLQNEGAGLLANGGASVCVRVPKKVWEEIKHLYGGMTIFTSNPPFVRELQSEQDYSSATLQSELKEIRTGAEPLDQKVIAQKLNSSKKTAE